MKVKIKNNGGDCHQWYVGCYDMIIEIEPTIVYPFREHANFDATPFYRLANQDTNFYIPVDKCIVLKEKK